MRNEIFERVSISEHWHIRVDRRRVTTGRNHENDDQFNDYTGGGDREHSVRFTAHGVFDDGQVGWRFFLVGKRTPYAVLSVVKLYSPVVITASTRVVVR